MKLSCGTDSFPIVPHEVAVELIAGLGFDGHDVMLEANRHDIPLAEVRRDIASWAGRLDERVRGRGLEFSDIAGWGNFSSMAPNHPDPTHREQGLAFFRDILELTVRLRAPGLTMIPGIDWPGETHEESLARAGDELSRRATEARERGVRFSIEPGVGSVCPSPDDALRLCELAPDLELTLDYSHYVSLGFSEDEIEPLLPHTRHLHVRGATKGRLQAPNRESTVNYERMIDALRELQYDGFLTVEFIWIEWGGLNELDVLSETVMMRDRLRAKMANQDWSYPEFVFPIESALD